MEIKGVFRLHVDGFDDAEHNEREMRERGRGTSEPLRTAKRCSSPKLISAGKAGWQLVDATY